MSDVKSLNTANVSVEITRVLKSCCIAALKSMSVKSLGDSSKCECGNFFKITDIDAPNEKEYKVIFLSPIKEESAKKLLKDYGIIGEKQEWQAFGEGGNPVIQVREWRDFERVERVVPYGNEFLVVKGILKEKKGVAQFIEKDIQRIEADIKALKSRVGTVIDNPELMKAYNAGIEKLEKTLKEVK